MIINTNSPLQLDIPMMQGVMALAEMGQLVVITPFTLAGAMAPITIAGAVTLQNAEALAGVALTQMVRPGTPVMYGGFTSNVDMKTGFHIHVGGKSPIHHRRPRAHHLGESYTSQGLGIL